jgi:hypothetical protein
MAISPTSISTVTPPRSSDSRVETARERHGVRRLYSPARKALDAPIVTCDNAARQRARHRAHIEVIE